MSSFIIASNNTPTSSRHHPSQPYSTANDDFSPGLCRPNTMSRTIDLEATIEEWVNGLTSPLSTASERIHVLNDIEKTLVAVTDPTRTSTATFLLPVHQMSAVFWASQATAGYSLTEVLLAHVYRLHLDLERENELCKASASSSSHANVQGLGLERVATSPTYRSNTSHGVSDVQRQRVHSTVSEICIAITILQGLTLCSKASKRITQRKSALELLLQIVLAEYCTHLLPPILCPNPASSALTPTTCSFATLPNSPSTPTSVSSTSSPSPSKKSVPESSNDAPLSLPSGFALDLLMCILVDSDVAQERFTDMGGIHQIVQLSHKCADAVTTPASTPTTATSPTFAQALARSSHVTALKQTDLLCLEFRYFWSQLLQQGETVPRRSSFEGVGSAATSLYSATDESKTPKASPKKRVSRVGLREQRKEQEEMGGAGETPKATMRRRVAAPTTVRATSEEAPCRSKAAKEEAGKAPSGSPRKLRHSASVAELRQKPVSLSKSTVSRPPVPPLPVTGSPSSYTCEALASSRRQRASTTRPSTSDSRPHSRTDRREERTRRSTVSEVNPTTGSTDDRPGLSNFHPSRPGMSSRERPRIPSPLKARTPAQQVAELEDGLRRKQALAAQQAIPYRRLRSTTASTPLEDGQASKSRGRQAGDADENRNPFTSIPAEMGGAKAEMTTSVSQRSSGMSSAGSVVFGSAAGHGSLGAARIPPSPAVRRAQLARARSLSPTKLSLPRISTADAANA